jgi:aldehyde dehydrogenase
VGGAAYGVPSLAVHDPAHRDVVVGLTVASDQALVDRAVRAAAKAGSGWAARAADERADALRGAAAVAAADFEATAQLLTAEQGKVLWESRLDVAAAPYLLHVAAGLAGQAAEEGVVRDERGTFLRRRRPIGVVAVIVPWNYPIVLALNAVAPALAAGNTVVVKPPELAPLALGQVLSALAGALPPGVLNVCPGTGPDTGEALVAHPLVRKVMFTGGVASGRQVMRMASDHVAGVALELGGNDPALVLEDASIDDRLLRQLRQAIFTCSGQICYAVKRIYVHRARHDELVEGLCDVVDEIAVGDGRDPRSTIGPLIDERSLRRVRTLVDQAERAGAAVRVLGHRVDPEGWHDGHFMRPRVVSALPHDSPLVAAEQFGPAIPVVAFDSEAQAVAMANDSEYGLAASVWSDDVDGAFAVARKVEAGTVFINVHRVGASDHTTPFGGVKQSGIGRGNGWASIEELTELQMLIHRADAEHLPGPPAISGRH